MDRQVGEVFQGPDGQWFKVVKREVTPYGVVVHNVSIPSSVAVIETEKEGEKQWQTRSITRRLLAWGKRS